MALQKPQLNELEQEAFQRSVTQVCQATLARWGSDPKPEAVIHFVGHLQRSVDKVFQDHVARGAKPACQAGCSHCCRTRVEALAPEVFRIAQHVRQLPLPKQEDIVQRLQKQAQEPRGVLPWSERSACAFLENDLCSIYEVRPAACRQAHSLDAAPCADMADEIPQDLALLLGAQALLKGVAQAYAQHGFDAAGVELAQGVLVALTDASASARWQQHERVFRSDPN